MGVAAGDGAQLIRVQARCENARSGKRPLFWRKPTARIGGHMTFVTNESGDDSFTLTSSDLSPFSGYTITLSKTTQVIAFTAFQYSGVAIYAFDAANEQILLDGG